ncbi:MAG TPA: hypothetical protein VI259_12770 [Gemmatimonadaceae bacterium]
MRNVLAILILITGLARAEKPTTPLPTKVDPLTAAKIDAAIEKVLKATILKNQIDAQTAPSYKFLIKMQEKYRIQFFKDNGQQLDHVDAETGEITRGESSTPPAQSPAPKSEPAPEKPAKK